MDTGELVKQKYIGSYDDEYCWMIIKVFKNCVHKFRYTVEYGKNFAKKTKNNPWAYSGFVYNSASDAEIQAEMAIHLAFPCEEMMLE